MSEYENTEDVQWAAKRYFSIRKRFVDEFSTKLIYGDVESHIFEIIEQLQAELAEKDKRIDTVLKITLTNESPLCCLGLLIDICKILNGTRGQNDKIC